MGTRLSRDDQSHRSQLENASDQIRRPMSHAAATCTAQRHTPNHLIWLAVQNKVRTIVLEALRVYSMRLVHLEKSEASLSRWFASTPVCLSRSTTS